MSNIAFFPTQPRKSQMENSPSLQSLVSLADLQIGYETQIADAEAELSELKALLKDVSEKSIPTMMEQLGMKDFTLSNGRKLIIKDFYSGQPLGPESYDWLLEQGYGDMVKAKVVVPYSFTDANELTAITTFLDRFKIPYETKTEIHHMTFGAFLREQDKKNVELPAELFKTYHGKKTNIK